MPAVPPPIRVLITGFGAFSRVSDNPSYKIALALPPTLPDITLHSYPHPVRVSYPSITTLIPSLWRPRTFSYILHIGVGIGPRYALETRAWEHGYASPDVDNFAPDTSREREDWGRCLKTGVDVPKVLEEVRGKVQLPEGMTVGLSENAGRYLCEYVYFASLREEETAGESGRVLFLHVPPEEAGGSVDVGVEVVKAVVEALVRCGERGDRAAEGGEQGDAAAAGGGKGGVVFE